jgi:hypothetical protein
MSAALFPAFAAAALLLAGAGGAKAASPHAARTALSVAGIRLPAVAVRALGAGEVAVGAAALLAPGTATAAVAALAYGVFFLFVGRLLHVASGTADCGCFGSAGPEAGAVHLVVNACACTVCILAAASTPRGPGWMLAQSPLTALATCAGVVAAAYATYLVLTAFPRAWRSYGGPEAR